MVRSVRSPAFPVLRRGQTITSPLSGRRYVIEGPLGRGTFGSTYSCRRYRRREVLCLKITLDQASWHREAYMAELLAGHPRVIRVEETFPVFRRGLPPAYAAVMEFAEHGTLADEINLDGPWSQSHAVREIRALLGALGKLHASGALHRDVTPFNVFVCGPNKMLKLGDFGITRHGPQRGIPATTFAPWFVDTDLYFESRLRWTLGDDLWQVGQLLAVLLTGEVRPIAPREVRTLPCSDHLKVVIRRAIGEPRHRYDDAATFAAALRARPPLHFGRVSTLDGRTVVFTGPMEIPRAVAEELARRAGANVRSTVSGAVDVAVVGDISPNWATGSAGGVKMLQVAALQEQGYRITVIGERQFRRLVAGVRRPRSTSQRRR